MSLPRILGIDDFRGLPQQIVEVLAAEGANLTDLAVGFVDGCSYVCCLITMDDSEDCRIVLAAQPHNATMISPIGGYEPVQERLPLERRRRRPDEFAQARGHGRIET